MVNSLMLPILISLRTVCEVKAPLVHHPWPWLLKLYFNNYSTSTIAWTRPESHLLPDRLLQKISQLSSSSNVMTQKAAKKAKRKKKWTESKTKKMLKTNTSVFKSKAVAKLWLQQRWKLLQPRPSPRANTSICPKLEVTPRHRYLFSFWSLRNLSKTCRKIQLLTNGHCIGEQNGVTPHHASHHRTPFVSAKAKMIGFRASQTTEFPFEGGCVTLNR